MSKPTAPGKPADKHKNAPWLPADWELADAGSIQALSRGEAEPAAQQRALKFIIENICETYGMSFRPGEDGRRDSDFAEGKRHVGNQIIKLLRLNLSQFRRKEPA